MPTSISDLEKSVNSALTTAIKTSKVYFDQLFLEIDFDNLYSTILYLKTNNKCRFKQLIDITAVDYPNREKRFNIVYFLLSHENNLRVIINIAIEENAKVPSITKIYPSANWMEREVFDMYGIIFKDHPNLKRILTDYEFQGHPLRKDFPLTGHTEVRYSENKKKVISEPVKLEQAYRNFDFESPWEGTKYINKEVQSKKDKDEEKQWQNNQRL